MSDFLLYYKDDLVNYYPVSRLSFSVESNFGISILFLTYINDLSNVLQSRSKLFADDTSLFSTVRDIVTATKPQV